MERARIVILTAGDVLAEVVIKRLVASFDGAAVIEEKPETRAEIIRRWLSLLGWSRTMGQLAFGPLQRLASIRARRRRSDILAAAHLDTTRSPEVVLVIGTRMIRAAALACTSAPFINYHAGVTPMYRGQHGGYWAVASGDVANAGVTIHLVYRGVDTGKILSAAHIAMTADDTVATIHYLQLAAAMPLVLQAVEAVLSGRLEAREPGGASKQWFYPTVIEYIANGVRRVCGSVRV